MLKFEMLKKEYSELKIKYDDLKAAYERKSVLRVIEKVSDDHPYDIGMDDGENVIVHKPKKSGRKHSSRNHKKVQFIDGQPIPEVSEMTDMIVLGKPVNRVPGQVTPPLVVGHSMMAQQPLHMRKASPPIVQKIPVAAMNQGGFQAEKGLFARQGPADHHTLDVREYHVDPVEPSHHAYPQSTSHAQPIRESGYQSRPESNSTGQSSDLRGSMTNKLPPGFLSTNPFETSTPLQHVQASVSTGMLPPGFIEAGGHLPPRFEHSSQNYPQTSHHESDHHRMPQSVSRRIAAERIPQENHPELNSYQPFYQDLRGGHPRLEERTSSLDYSRGEISYLTNSPHSSMLRPSADTVPHRPT